LKDKLETKVEKLPSNCWIEQLLKRCWATTERLKIQRFQSKKFENKEAWRLSATSQGSQWKKN